MENKSNTRAKKLSKQIAIRIEGEASPLERQLICSYFKNEPLSKTTVHVLENQFSTSLSDETLLNRPIILKTNTQNLSSMAKLLDSYLYINKPISISRLIIDAKKDRRLYTSAQTKFDQLIRKSGSLKQTLTPLTDVFSDDQEIEQLFDELHGLESVLPQILKLSGFQFYQSVQLIVHEKGKVDAESLHLTPEGEIISSSISSRKFNSLFTHFKKSKNKLFNQNQISNDALFIVGPFLAKELELREHNIIFIISRNGFLPPSEEEITYFNNIYPSLRKSFNYLLTKSKLTDREKFLSLSLNNYPFALIISVGENIIFKNKLVSNDHVQMIQCDDPTLYHIALKNDKHLYLFPNNHADLISDLNHYQRISLLGELLNTLKHELSNPLFGLKLTADILESEESNVEAKEMLHSISDYALRCQRIIDNFSDLYLEHDQWTDINLGHLIKEVLTLTKSETRGIPIKFDPPVASSPIIIKSQATLLSQIIFNLIVNSSQAIKSSPTRLDENFINIDISELSDRFLVNVSDSGPGISVEIREQVFKPYFTTKEKGTGLGLSICKKLCQKLGYSLECVNGSFPGATFSIVLPKKL